MCKALSLADLVVRLVEVAGRQAELKMASSGYLSEGCVWLIGMAAR